MQQNFLDLEATNVDVLLHYEGFLKTRCKANQIGIGGMFVKTNPLPFRRDTQLEVEFELAGPAGTRRYRLPALVQHRSPEGLGLMFTDFDGGAFQSLRGQLHGE